MEVRLIARNNEVLATKKTDALGVATFDPGLARGEGGLAPGLVVATEGADYGFLDLGTAAFDLTDRGVKGRAVSGAMDAFLYTERGVYRTGETVALTALLRDGKGVAVPGLPLTIVVRRPDGVEYRRDLVQDQGLGGRALSIPILPGSLRGTWRVAAYTDPKGSSIGEASFLVEDYVPERLELTLTPKVDALRRGTAGSHRPGRALSLRRTGEQSRRHRRGFGRGILVQRHQGAGRLCHRPRRRACGGFDHRDRAECHHRRAGTRQPAGPCAGCGSAAAHGSPHHLARGRGGRTSGGAQRDAADPARRARSWPCARPSAGSLARARMRPSMWFCPIPRAGVSPAAMSPGACTRSNGAINGTIPTGAGATSRSKSTRRVADGRIAVAPERPARISAPVEWGTYRLDVSAPDLGETAQTSLSFTVGWSGDQTADTPDLLDMTLDKASYRAGETMQLRLNPRFKGKATLAVVSDRMHDIRVVDVAAAARPSACPCRPPGGRAPTSSPWPIAPSIRRRSGCPAARWERPGSRSIGTTATFRSTSMRRTRSGRGAA